MGYVCLAYHRLSAAPAARADPYTVRPAQFAAQMGWLARAGFVGVPLGGGSCASGGARGLPLGGRRPREIALTFDDGDCDFLTEAWPVLRAHGFGATVFVVAGCVGGAADWPGAEGMRLMGWDALRALAQAGVEIGAHGWTHTALDARPTAEVEADLRRAYAALAEHLPAPPAGLAYPYGRWSAGAAEAAARAGFCWAATARGGRNHATTPPFKLRRALVRGRDGALAFQLKARTGYATLVDWRMDWRRLP